MNAIDEIGQSLGVPRAVKERDATYALRILQVLHRTYKATHADGWRQDRESNEWQLETENGRAGVYYNGSYWIYLADYRIAAGMTLTKASGKAETLEKALAICSLVLS